MIKKIANINFDSTILSDGLIVAKRANAFFYKGKL